MEVRKGEDAMAEENLNDQQVLSVIEFIAGDDFCEEMNMAQADGMDEQWPADLKTAVEKLMMIYRISHGHVQSNSCYRNHDSWRKEAARMACGEDFGEAFAK